MIDYLGIKERVEKFDIEHGLDAVMYGAGWLLFPDAAIRETNPLGALREPPDDLYQRAKLIVKYREIKLGLAVEEFTTFKRFLLTQANQAHREGTPPPSQEAIATLKQLKAKAASCQALLEDAREYLEDNKPAGLRQRELNMQANREKAEDLLASLKTIEV